MELYNKRINLIISLITIVFSISFKDLNEAILRNFGCINMADNYNV